MIPNWSRYQPRLKNGKPNREWIRLQCNLEDDVAFWSLPTGAKWMLITIWRITGRTERWVPNDADWVRMRLGCTHDTTRIVRGWLDDAIRMGLLTVCNQQIIEEFATRDVTRRDVTGQERKSFAPKRRKTTPSEPVTIAWSGQILAVSEKTDSAITTAYPSVDRHAEYAKADAWLVSNPAKRKKDLGRFINNWCSRAQERSDFRESKSHDTKNNFFLPEFDHA